jgi:predicted alpha/beta hydrolase family esterase
MKNALILHGTNGNSQENWFPWLKNELEHMGYKVWVPDLPGADTPNIQRYNKFIFENKEWMIDNESVLVGHSSGAVALLGLLQALPDEVIVDTCILVGAFKDDLEWDALKELFVEPLNFEKIRKHAKKIIFIHSDNDPYCPLDHARYLSEQLQAELKVIPGQKHFSTGTFGEEYREFPLLLEILKD